MGAKALASAGSRARALPGPTIFLLRTVARPLLVPSAKLTFQSGGMGLFPTSEPKMRPHSSQASWGNDPTGQQQKATEPRK